MGTVGYLLVLVLAIIVSAQLFMLMDRHSSLAKRLRDLGTGGDSFSLLGAAVLVGGALGALIGSLFNAPADAAAGGLAAGLLTWAIAVLWAHKRPEPPPRHGEH